MPEPVTLASSPQAEPPPTRIAEVFATFLLLGCSSLDGPVAHIGIFHEALVRRRGWLTEDAYAGLVSMCQFLPGPASSKLGFLIGDISAVDCSGRWPPGSPSLRPRPSSWSPRRSP
jgi:hypothetical protein